MPIELTVDGHPVTVPDGASVLDAVNRAGVYLPQLCKEPERPPLGACRTCLVGIEGRRGTPASCTTPAHPGMVVHTDTPEVEHIRRGVLQLTLDMLPEGDPARLGQLGVAATRANLVRGRFLPEPPLAVSRVADDSNPIWTLDRQRCILCARCVDACQEVQHIGVLALIGHGSAVAVGPAGLGPLGQSNCTSCGQCWATCPTQAIRLREPLVSASSAANLLPQRPVPSASAVPVAVSRGDNFPTITRQVETVCPYCGVGCGVRLDLDADDTLVQVEGVPEHGSSRGMLCVKGRFGLGFVRGRDRLTVPLARRAPGGPLEAVDWDEALDRVARGFARHHGAFAAIGSAKVTTEESYLLQKFTRAVMGTNNIDHCARLCHSPSLTAMGEMLGGGSTTNSYADFERAGCLLVVGADPDTNHPVIAARVREGVARGAALVVINPKHIHLCDRAALWLRPWPGTDVALFNGLAAVALEEGLWDQEFVATRTEDFAAWRAFLAPYTPTNVARVTGVPVPDLRRAARLIARPAHGGTCFLWGMGLTQHTRGVANVQALINLALLTGQIGKPGSGLSPLRGQNNVQGCCDAGVLPDTLPGYQGLGAEARARFAQVWGVEPPSVPGLRLTEFFEAAQRGEVRALYLVGENPLLSEPNLDHARVGMQALEFLVVQTIFPNEVTDLADVVLPAALFAEKDGTFTNSERRVQLVRQAFAPPGEARADWAITCAIARHTARLLGQPGDGFAYAHPRDIFAEMATLVPAQAGIGHARLEHGGLQWPCPTPEHPGTPLLYDERFPRGRARFIPVEAGLPAAELPDADYPLVLNTGRVLQHWHGGDLSRQVAGLTALYPRVEVAINPADAIIYGLADGDAVRVATRRGALTASARVTEDVRQGEVFMPFVRLDGAAANLLTNDVYDPRARIPEYKVCAVRIARVADGQPAGRHDHET